MAKRCDNCKPDLCLFAGGGSGGGGGGGGGGFTLLHGTHSVVEEVEYVTLPIAASALYALMQTSSVAFDYTIIGVDYSITVLDSLITAGLNHTEGYADTYFFVGSERNEYWFSNWSEGTDAVVLYKEGGK